MNAYEMTPRQYHEYRCNQYTSANPSITKAEYNECYPLGSLDRDWFDAVLKAARDGTVLKPIVLDRIAEKFNLYRIFHDYPGAVPKGYLAPKARKMNAKH